MQQVQDCVRSINDNLGDVTKECIVVSNSEYTESQISSYLNTIDGIKIINTEANLGYAGGVNRGLREANGRYIYVVNPDCLLLDSGVLDIMTLMDKDSHWAISGPKVIDENKITQPSCRRFPKLWTFLLVRSFFKKLPGAYKEFNRYFMKDYDRASTRMVDWVSGGATLIKSSALEKIGGMDERYFLYMEDVDWCRSAWNSGYKVAYCPISTVVHAGQHQSIKFGPGMLKNMHLRWHLKSLFKYFIKYRLRQKPESDFYHNEIE